MLQALKALLKTQPAIHRAARSLRLAMSSYQEKEMGLLSFLVNPAMVAIDVGAHYGIYTHALLKLGAPVVAIEANPKLAAILTRLYGRKARIVCAAASSSAGEATLRIPRGRSNGIATVEAQNTLNFTDVDEIEIPKVALNDIDLGPVGFIKIDVEGHELDVLLGANKLLARDHPTILVEIEERHRQGAVNSICETLSFLGYSGFMLNGGRLSSVSNFDATRDQLVPTNRLDDLNSGRYKGRYINNFLFVA